MSSRGRRRLRQQEIARDRRRSSSRGRRRLRQQEIEQKGQEEAQTVADVTLRLTVVLLLCSYWTHHPTVHYRVK